ncbi:MAG: DUF4381 domain-containing protein [Xanthobacteraceae bacterium]|nr:DUF4381 domain-containing protein [Xanthobacteraceae bacterium]
MAEAPQADPVTGLVDIPLPAPVGLWPQTWESRLAAVVLAAGLIAGVAWLVRWWSANRYRRAALSELGRIEHTLDNMAPADLAAALASLVRRTALAAFPREQVAPLAGPAWLSFLDKTCGGRDFSDGPGRTLAISAYQRSPADPRALVVVVRHWIKAHHVERAA